QPKLADRFKNHADRIEAHDEIDGLIGAWTAGLDAYEVMRRLQAESVPAGVVQRSSDLLRDPQNQHRSFYRYLEHPMMGHVPYAGHQYKISNYDNGPRGPAPMLGEHSFEVLSQVLNFTDEEIAAAYTSGAIN
ncbi:MAG: CoA transferase, partial [Pseudomonadales bacterium]|nr:CoA transferase [Pseudomonadales bacterium]